MVHFKEPHRADFTLMNISYTSDRFNYPLNARLPSSHLTSDPEKQLSSEETFIIPDGQFVVQ